MGDCQRYFWKVAFISSFAGLRPTQKNKTEHVYTTPRQKNNVEMFWRNRRISMINSLPQQTATKHKAISSISIQNSMMKQTHPHCFEKRFISMMDACSYQSGTGPSTILLFEHDVYRNCLKTRPPTTQSSSKSWPCKAERVSAQPSPCPRCSIHRYHCLRPLGCTDALAHAHA